MRRQRIVSWAQALVLIFLPFSARAETWNSPHISIVKVASWSEFLDVLNQPHLDVVIHNDGSAAVGTLDFHCRLFILDRATPILEDEWSTTLDRVIQPGKQQSLELRPNMFSELGRVIEHGYRNAAWSCYVSRILTAEGQIISFEPGALTHKGGTLGIGYTPVPEAMLAPLKLPDGGGMWVLKVQAGSIAEAAGIRVGDVVLSIDGKRLTAVRDLTSDLDAATAARRPAELTLSRAGATLHIPVRLAGASGAN